MERTNEKIKKLEKILEKEGAPILQYFNVGMPRDAIVQYMTVHKYVSSTQRYQISNLDDLKNELQQDHPMS